MSSTGGARKRARRLVTRALRGAARRVPLDLAPSPVRPRLERARLDVAVARASRHPEESLTLLRSLVGGPHTVTASRHIAQILLKQGRPQEAYEVLRDVVDRAQDDPRFLLLHARLAREHGDDETAVRTMDRVVALVPPGQKALERTVRELRVEMLPQAGRLKETITSSPEGARLDTTSLDDLLTVGALQAAAGEGSQALRNALDEAWATRHEPLGVIARALAQVGAWDELLTQVDRVREEGTDHPPLWRLRRTASQAAREGHLQAAARIARYVLEHDPEDREMGELAATAEDQLRVLAAGWADEAVEPLEHVADSRSVLALLGQSLPIRSGGYATRSHGILTSLASRGWSMAAATRLGFPYDLWWSADDERVVEPVDVVDGIPYHRLLTPGVRDYPRVPLADYVRRGAEMATALAREHRAGLVHASSLSDVGLVGMTVAHRLDVPFVYEMRGLKQLLEEARTPRFAGSQAEQALDVLESTVARAADRLFVITEALGAEMVRMGVDPDRITVVPNGVHVDRFAPRPRDEDLEAELGVAGKTVIGYAGGLVHYEGLSLLLEAADRLRRTRQDFHVLVVGDGAHERALHSRARALALDDVVTFTGRVPHHDVERYLSLVDIAPFPRLPLRVCELISPIKPFEAMAMAKAVVVSDVAALTEIVHDGDTGRHFAKGDPAALADVLGELVDDPDARDRMGRRARDWVVANRDWARITDRVDEAYRALLAPTDA